MAPFQNCHSLVVHSDLAVIENRTYKTLPNLLQLDLWASMSGQRSFKFEPAALPLIRYQAVGERLVVLIKAINLRAWLDDQQQKKPEKDREKVTYGRLQGALMRMSDSDMAEFAAKYPGSVFTAYLQAKEWLYTPPAWIVGEKTGERQLRAQDVMDRPLEYGWAEIFAARSH